MDITAPSTPIVTGALDFTRMAGTHLRQADTPERIAEVASQFEALLIGQLMKGMRESMAGGWMGGEDAGASGPIGEMAEQQLAAIMSAQGGFGLAAQLKTALAAQPRTQTGSDAPAGS